jgi:hypothetical protein
MRLKGFDLLLKVESLEKDFISGAPWKGKEKALEATGYVDHAADGTCKYSYGDFHEAYEDARIFRERYGDEAARTEHDPQHLFNAFMYACEQWETAEVEAHVALHGIESALDLEEEFQDLELRYC